MDRFNIGDRVVAVVDCPADNPSIHVGDAGTICDGDCGDGWVGVCWDSPVDAGHDCDGECDYGYGWRVPEATLDFELDDIEPPFQFDENEFVKLFNGRAL